MTKPVCTNGKEWIVDARGCNAPSLCCLDTLKGLFEKIIADLGLRTIGEPRWHQFPGSGGITGLCLLSESHLACHTFPEHGSLCLNLFCCVPREAWDFERNLVRLFGATSVNVVVLTRDYGPLEEMHVVGTAQEARRG